MPTKPPELVRRYRRQNDFDATFALASRETGVPVTLLKAVTAHESAFNPLARRPEAPRPSLPPTRDHPHGGDESRGLMQLLVRTGRLLNFRGHPDELFKPEINVPLGARLLRDALRTAGGNIEDALSAYNGGVRPQLGFGRKLPSGKYGNQAYVNRVLELYTYFQHLEEAAARKLPTPPSMQQPSATRKTPAGGTPKVGTASAAALLLVLVLGGLALAYSPR